MDNNCNPISTTLIRGTPHFLFKNATTITSISFRFNCPILNQCPFHSLSKQDLAKMKVNNKKISCPFSRSLKIHDSLLMLPGSLDSLMQDMKDASVNTNKDLSTVFPNTYNFIVNQLEFSPQQFKVITQGKCPQPFEQISSFEYLQNTKTIPPKEAFFSHLKGDDIENKESISTLEYDRFCTIWNELNINTMLEILGVYAGVDCTMTTDILLFYFEHLYRVTNLYATYYSTSASYAIASALFNSKDLKDKNKPLKLPLVDERFALLYNKGLTGGYSFTSSNYCNFTNLDTNTHTQSPLDETLRLGVLFDINSLYPSSISLQNPIDSFVMLSETENREEFDLVSKQLISGNLDFFYDELFENNTIYFCEVETGFEKNADLSFVNFELSSFPFYEKVSLNMLSQDQRMRAKLLNRNPEKEEKRLVSFLKKNNRIAQYAENLIYSRNFHDIAITRVYNIIKSYAGLVFRPWITKLEKEKNRNVSKVFNKIIKNLSNSIPGV